MKISKKILGLILIAGMSMSLVACSSNESSKVESGSAQATEQNQNKKEEGAETKKEDLVLVDDDVIKATVTEKKTDVLGAGYMISIENKSDKKIIVQTRDTSVNGTMEDPVFSLDIMPGKTAKGMMQFMNIKNLDELKDLEGKLVVLSENFEQIQSYDINIK